MFRRLFCALGASAIAVWLDSAHAYTPPTRGANHPNAASFPLDAAGWGPKAGKNLFLSRWAEDWTGARLAGKAPPLKAIPLGDDAFLTLSSEFRIRYESYENAPPTASEDSEHGLFRGIIGADLRYTSHFHVYGELGTGRVTPDNHAPANFHNGGSLQQLFMDVRANMGPVLIGAMAGRQEFADGPRQLISLSDGPNLHRTWNGLRFFAHSQRFRVGVYDFSATRLERGFFDEEIHHAEILKGVNASLIVLPEGSVYLDPFWIRSENPKFRAGPNTGLDMRDTYGLRLWGREDNLQFDWTLARQTGRSLGRDVAAWGVFAVQSFSLSGDGWKPRLTSHIDIASGGGVGGSKGFNQLYSSSMYLGEGRFLSLRNLLLIAPGISLSPTPKMNISLEYGWARRLTEDDAAYAGGNRPYPGTQNVHGNEIGGLFRVAGSWSLGEYLSFYGGVDHLAAGHVLRRAGLKSGMFGYAAITFRY